MPYYHKNRLLLLTDSTFHMLFEKNHEKKKRKEPEKDKEIVPWSEVEGLKL